MTRPLSGRGGVAIPPLWLFTDTTRLPDPRAAVARLPRGLAGVVFRHDNHPDRAAIGRDVARICRARRLILVVAGDARLAAALGAGVHLRGGRWPGPIRPSGFVTSSAHGMADLRRAARAGAALAFLSPAFSTASHPGAPALGPACWALIARRAAFPGVAAAGRSTAIGSPPTWSLAAGPLAPGSLAAGSSVAGHLVAETPGAGGASAGATSARALAIGALGGVTPGTIRRLPRALCRAAGAIGALA